MFELNDIKDTLKGVVSFSDCEKEFGVKWLSGSSQAAFYIGDAKANQDDVNNFISGEHICSINLKSYLSYLRTIKKIISKYGSMYNGPLDKIESIYDRFSKIKECDANVVLSYNYPERYIRILNNKINYALNVKKYGDLILKNGDDFRHSYLGGITLITIKKINDNYELFIEILNDWRGKLMEINSSKLDLAAFVKIFNDEVETNLKDGKTIEMAAEIFGIKYCPLLNKYNSRFTYKDIVESSNYNKTGVIDWVKNGIDISPSILWDKTIDDERNFNVYGIHITLKNSALDKENPHVCIGWKGLGDLTNIETKNDLRNHYLSLYPDINKYALGQNISQIWMFKNEIKIGDYIVYFDRNIAHVGRIIGNYEFISNPVDQDNDYVNNRKVEWIKDIPYKDLPEDYRNSAKTQKSIFRLNSYKSLINDIVNGNKIEEDDDSNNSDVVIYDWNSSTIKDGKNLIVYGTPGCGKSYYVEHVLLDGYPKENYIRTTFFADYTNTDFVGQILPIVDGDKVTYQFNPGPFTLALAQAIRKPNEKVALVIEELNRGSAPSIFGDIFQLLDRKNGISEYPITNINIIDYLNKEFAGQYLFKDIKLPGNLFIFATMNTSDQNVFTLDTAFKRRWEFKKLINEFKDDHEFKGMYIPSLISLNVTWEELVNAINEYMLELTDNLNNEDKQIGVYFVDKTGMRKEEASLSSEEDTKKFAYKVLEYLWDDVSKFARDKWFKEDIKSLDQLVEEYLKSGTEVFSDGVKSKLNK